jgi:hypothetical protein
MEAADSSKTPLSLYQIAGCHVPSVVHNLSWEPQISYRKGIGPGKIDWCRKVYKVVIKSETGKVIINHSRIHHN